MVQFLRDSFAKMNKYEHCSMNAIMIGSHTTILFDNYATFGILTNWEITYDEVCSIK